MKFFHLSDLHLGKQLHYYDLAEEQEDMLRQIADYARERHPDAILIAGDVYDRAVPSGETQELFDRFLTELSEIRPQIPVLIIAGNHDNAARLSYARGFLRKHAITIAAMPPQKEEERLEQVVLQDEYGEVVFRLLPFTRPGMVRSFLPEAGSFDGAVSALIRREEIDPSVRNVLAAHQFFTSGGEEPETCDSEWKSLSIGGLDHVDTACLEAFDYVALGHLHGEQKVGSEAVRYSGSPFPYSVSEEHQRKGILEVSLGPKGAAASCELLPLIPLRRVRSFRGTLEEAVREAEQGAQDDYIQITLTDEELFRPRDTLDAYFHHILEVRVDNSRSRAQESAPAEAAEDLDPLRAFAAFYEQMNGRPLSSGEEKILEKLLSEAEEEMP